jgi:hypothetical protein
LLRWTWGGSVSQPSSYWKRNGVEWWNEWWTTKIFLKGADLIDCCLRHAGFLLFLLTLKMEVIHSSETSVDFERTTLRYIPEDRTLHNHSENLRFCLDCCIVGRDAVQSAWRWRRQITPSSWPQHRLSPLSVPLVSSDYVSQFSGNLHRIFESILSDSDCSLKFIITQWMKASSCPCWLHWTVVPWEADRR